tara:strand:+ start:295 stop:519 length:225 start_codon:yes stop_codon:yes gene_type:complete
MSVVNFPPAAPARPIACSECDFSKFFIYDDQTFICADCGTPYDWENGTNGNGHEQSELIFEPDPELLAEVKNAP